MVQELTSCRFSLVGWTRSWAALISTAALIAFGWATSAAGFEVEQDALPGEAKTGAEAGDLMVVSGHVLSQGGKPVADARVAVLTRSYLRSEKPIGYWPLGLHPGLNLANRVFAAGKTDAEGRFSLSGLRYSPALPTTCAVLITSAPGHGLTTKLLDHAAARQDVTVALQPEHAVWGQILDAQGKPAVGAEVRVHTPPVQENAPHEKIRPILGGAIAYYVPPEGEFWPKPVVTDDQGRFWIAGLAPGNATLEVRSDGSPAQRFAVETADSQGTKEAAFKLPAGPRLEGRVTEEGGKEPVAGAKLVVISPGINEIVQVRAGADGRYAVHPFAGKSFEVVVHPPDGSPCLVVRKMVKAVTTDRQELNISLPRGVLVSGRVTEAASGKPVPGARVQYRQRHFKNPFLRKDSYPLFLEEGVQSPASTLETAISKAEGQFQLAVAPGPGHLFVLGPTSEYLHVETSAGELDLGKPGGFRYYPDAVVSLDLKPGTSIDPVAVHLRRGVTIHGRVLGPDGKPVQKFMVMCRSYAPTGWHWWQTPGNHVEGRDGRFELPGCVPGKPFTAWFFDPDGELGATADLLVKSGDDQPVTVRLQRCGAAVVRIVTPDGKPLEGYRPLVSFVVTPGVTEPGNLEDADRPLEGDWVHLPFWGFDPKYHEPKVGWKLWTDARGMVTIPKLIPGATYRIVSRTIYKGGHPHFTDFTVKAGETLALPDQTERPSRAHMRPKAK